MLHISNRFVGGLIGKGGQVMKVLEEKSGARITFGKPAMGSDINADRVCTVSGTPQAVREAQDLIDKELERIRQRVQ